MARVRLGYGRNVKRLCCSMFSLHIPCSFNKTWALINRGHCNKSGAGLVKGELQINGTGWDEKWQLVFSPLQIYCPYEFMLSCMLDQSARILNSDGLSWREPLFFHTKSCFQHCAPFVTDWETVICLCTALNYSKHTSWVLANDWLPAYPPVTWDLLPVILLAS